MTLIVFQSDLPKKDYSIKLQGSELNVVYALVNTCIDFFFKTVVSSIKFPDCSRNFRLP